MTQIYQLEILLTLLAAAPMPSPQLNWQMHQLFVGDNPDIPTKDYTGSIDDIRRLIKHAMPGWIYRVAECSVSDDAWLIPDFNDPTYGPGFVEKYSHQHQRDPVTEFGTDVDRRPAGNPALAMCMSLVIAKIAAMKLEN